MTHAEALKKLQQDPTLSISLVTPDATGNWFVRHPVFLDDSGELRMAHPTEKTGDVPAPLDGDYRLDQLDDESEEDDDDFEDEDE